MVEFVNPPDDIMARRMEARRRRAEREGLVPAEPIEDIDSAPDESRRPAPPAGASQSVSPPPPPAPPGAEEPGRLVEFRKKDKKERKGRELQAAMNPEADTHPGALPVPEIASSRLLNRLNEIKQSIAISQSKKRKSSFNPVIWTFVLAVLLPSVAITGYMYFWASKQYASEIRFGVRNMQAPASSAGSASMAMMGSATINDLTDSYVVVEYLQSREFVEDLSKRVNLQKIYSIDDADWWYRMQPEVSVEKMTEYVKSMMLVTFDMYTGIVSVRVRAFTSSDAKMMGDEVLTMTEALVNRISERARRNVVRDAEAEVSRAETRLKSARAAIAKFRSEEGQVDPNTMAVGFSTTINQLESELTRLKAELNQLTQTMSPTAPRVRVQQSRVEALEKQIDDEKVKVALKNRSGAALSSQLQRYEELVTERDFAQQAYTQTMATLERSRMDAERNQRYLALIVSPRPAEDSQYPERLRYSFLAFLGLFSLWAVCSLVLGSIRDHMQ